MFLSNNKGPRCTPDDTTKYAITIYLILHIQIILISDYLDKSNNDIDANQSIY